VGEGEVYMPFGNVGKVVVEVRGAEHEITRGMGISPPKPNIKCDALDNGGGLLKLAEMVQETCGVR
jgi:hypothetical protein